MYTYMIKKNVIYLLQRWITIIYFIIVVRLNPVNARYAYYMTIDNDLCTRVRVR